MYLYEAKYGLLTPLLIFETNYIEAMSVLVVSRETISIKGCDVCLGESPELERTVAHRLRR